MQVADMYSKSLLEIKMKMRIKEKGRYVYVDFYLCLYPEPKRASLELHNNEAAAKSW